MNAIAIIPARLASTRLPEKLMKPLGNKPIIVQTYLATKATGLFSEVIVATDSPIIAQAIENQGGKTFLSQREHSCGSDRIAEAAAHTSANIIVNVQGDEPFIDKSSLTQLLAVFRTDDKKEIDLASLMTPLTLEEDIQNPNNVKVVTDINGFALYFSRSVIPFVRDNDAQFAYKKHIGVYAFRREALMSFITLPSQRLELSEKLEQLRYLEYGKRIKMIETPHQSIGIDTLADLEKARKLFAHKQ